MKRAREGLPPFLASFSLPLPGERPVGLINFYQSYLPALKSNPISIKDTDMSNRPTSPLPTMERSSSPQKTPDVNPRGPVQLANRELEATRECERQVGLNKEGAISRIDPALSLQQRSPSVPSSSSHRQIHKRARSTSPSDRTAERSRRSGGSRPPSKKTKPDTSFAWTSASRAIEKGLRPELQETLRLLRIYAVDIEFAKSDLLNSAGVPEFPEAEWTNVLLGRAVDLEHVLREQYPLGRLNSHGALVPAKLETSSDWITAWFSVAAAVAYAFPHRQKELKDYELHVLELFTAVHESLQHRVINYDRRSGDASHPGATSCSLTTSTSTV